MTCQEFRAMGGKIAAQRRRPTNAEIAAAYKHYAACESCRQFSDDIADKAPVVAEFIGIELSDRALRDPESGREIREAHRASFGD